MGPAGKSPWTELDPSRIPTKTEVPELDAFVTEIGPHGRLLDLGCGTGVVSRKLAALGFDVTGVDVNERAVAEAEAAGGGTYFVRDVVAPEGLALPGGSFRIVVCQLVISVVGDTKAREALLRNAASVLESSGYLYLSASEVSDEVNSGYRELYLRDFPQTNERYTYFSRDDEGKVLYQTHHFTAPELDALLQGAGFDVVRMASRTEASSRRPNEAANFLYVVARKA